MPLSYDCEGVVSFCVGGGASPRRGWAEVAAGAEERGRLIPSAPPVAARSVPHGQYPSFRLEFIFRKNFSYKV
jgi:hypothetical protein